jgi:hypothetical protein
VATRPLGAPSELGAPSSARSYGDQPPVVVDTLPWFLGRLGNVDRVGQGHEGVDVLPALGLGDHLAELPLPDLSGEGMLAR